MVPSETFIFTVYFSSCHECAVTLDELLSKYNFPKTVGTPATNHLHTISFALLIEPSYDGTNVCKACIPIRNGMSGKCPSRLLILVLRSGKIVY